MIIIKKQPGHGGAANLGVVITLGSKSRINLCQAHLCRQRQHDVI